MDGKILRLDYSNDGGGVFTTPYPFQEFQVEDAFFLPLQEVENLFLNVPYVW